MFGKYRGLATTPTSGTDGIFIMTIDSATGTIEYPINDTSCEATKSITLNGQPCRLGDLQAGDAVELSGKPATSVKVTRPKPPKVKEPVKAKPHDKK